MFLDVSSIVYSNFQGASSRAKRHIQHHHVVLSFVKGDAVYLF